MGDASINAPRADLDISCISEPICAGCADFFLHGRARLRRAVDPDNAMVLNTLLASTTNTTLGYGLYDTFVLVDVLAKVKHDPIARTNRALVDSELTIYAAIF
jgi:hypothetical protein